MLIMTRGEQASRWPHRPNHFEDSALGDTHEGSLSLQGALLFSIGQL